MRAGAAGIRQQPVATIWTGTSASVISTGVFFR